MAGGSVNSSMGQRKRPRGNPDAVKPYQWKPGQSGNPAGGHKPATTLSKAVRSQLAKPFPSDPEHTWAEVIAHHIAQLALSKEASEALGAFAELCDRTEGKPHLSVGIGRQEIERVSVYELFNQYAQRDSPAVGNDNGADSGNSGQLASGSTGSNGPQSDSGSSA